VLPDFVLPAQVRMVAALPPTGNGKLDRAVLAAAGTGAEPESGGDEPLAEVRRRCGRRCSRMGVGPADNLFDVGGHSLVAAQVDRRLTEPSWSR